jgi:hypothetical protein
MEEIVEEERGLIRCHNVAQSFSEGMKGNNIEL